jgi:phage shock protein PspC (stress-responsive transcriptional regulator)
MVPDPSPRDDDLTFGPRRTAQDPTCPSDPMHPFGAPMSVERRPVDRPTDRDTAAPASPPPIRPPLRRPREGRILTGVAAGMADHLGIDVVIIRILIVVFAVLTDGLIVLAYVAAAIFVPAAEPGAPRPAPRRGTGVDGDRDPLFWVGVGIVVIGALWLSRGTVLGAGFFPGDGFGRLVIPLVLIAFGLALWRAGDRREVTPGAAATAAYQPPSAPSTSPAGPLQHPAGPTGPTGPTGSATSPPFVASTERPMDTDTTTRRIAEDRTTDVPPPAYGAGGSPPPPPGTGQPHDEPAWSPPPVPEPRERSLLTRFTLGIALVVLGALWSLRVADVLVIGWGTILAGPLLVIGIGLLIGSVIGRARWLILVGALVAPLVLLAQVAPFAYLADGWNVDSTSAGEIRSTPTDLSELRPEYQLGAGSVRLDLTELDLAGEDLAVRVDVGAGEIRIVVPDDVEVVATARSGIGQVRLFDDRSAAGIGAGEQQTTYTPEGSPQGRIELELQAGLGEIRVDLASRGDRGFGTSDDRQPASDDPDLGGEFDADVTEPDPEPQPEPEPEPEPASVGT